MSQALAGDEPVRLWRSYRRCCNAFDLFKILSLSIQKILDLKNCKAVSITRSLLSLDGFEMKRALELLKSNVFFSSISPSLSVKNETTFPSRFHFPLPY